MIGARQTREEVEPPMPSSIVQPLRRWDPERIGPYAIIGKLGAGAMGQVFLAKSAAGRLVAVKTIRVDLAEESGFRDRFAREVAAARRSRRFPRSHPPGPLSMAMRYYPVLFALRTLCVSS